MTGFVEHDRVLECMTQMRVFALPSNHEGLPNAVLEAAAVGVPIVATAVDGIKDVFEPGCEALLVPPRDPDALASALERVLGDDNLALALSQGALAAAARLTPDKERDSYLCLYEIGRASCRERV